jgi:polysaccharide biosynthesis protein PslH
MTMPTITSELGNAGLGAKAGEDLIVCADAVSFADAIQDLLANTEKAKRIALNGRRFVETHFRWEAMNLKLEAVLMGKAKNK